MYLSRPVYEMLPYAYMVLGAVLLGISFFVTQGSTWLMWAGMVALVVGLVLWLKRRDYRTARSEYNPRSLDD